MFAQNIIVSVFENVKNSKTPKKIDDEFANLWHIFRSKNNQYKVELLRKVKYGSKEYIEIKENLPCFTPSGTFSTRCKEGLIKHSGFICLDFDHLDNPEEFREYLRKFEFICYASLSCSGTGVFAMVEIEKPELHTRYYEAIEAFFAEEGVPLDPQCKDITRLRIASYDENHWFHHSNKKWDKALPAKELPTYTPRTSFDGDIDQKLFLAGLDYITRYGIDITVYRNHWLSLAACTHNLFGESGEAYFQELSQYHMKYNPEETRITYCSMAGKNADIGTFAAACSRSGVPDLRELLLKGKR